MTSRSEPDPLAAAAVSSSRSFCDVLDLLFFFFFLLRAVGSVVSESVEVRQRLCDEGGPATTHVSAPPPLSLRDPPGRCW